MLVLKGNCNRKFFFYIFAENDSIYYQNNVYQKLNDVSNPNRE